MPKGRQPAYPFRGMTLEQLETLKAAGASIRDYAKTMGEGMTKEEWKSVMSIYRKSREESGRTATVKE